MPQFSGDIVIGKNSIRFGDEVLKISNISRTSIFQFRNRERKAYESAKKSYEEAKKQYELIETYKKNGRVKGFLVATIIAFLISLFFFTKITQVGIIFLVIAGVFGLIAYLTARKKIEYYLSPPEEGHYPEKYGLDINMNSGYSVIFTAIGNDGINALRRLQEDINDADTQQEITIFNMNDNRVSVENNEGIISTGENAENTIEEKEPAVI